MKLDITFNADTSERFPVYAKYGNNDTPEDAYISLDTMTGECSADHVAGGGSISLAIFNGTVLTFAIRPDTIASDIADIITEHAGDFQKILDDICRNPVDQRNPNLADLTICQEPGGIVDGNFVEWLDGNYFPDANKTVSEHAAELHKCDGNEGYYFAGWLNSVDAIKTELLDLYRQMRDDDIDIPEGVAWEIARGVTS